MKFKKAAFEEFTRYHEFRRPDGTGWLNETETIQSPITVTCKDAEGTNTTSTMVGAVGGSGTTRASYIVKGGVAGKTYTYTIRVATSNSQAFEDRVVMEVV